MHGKRATSEQVLMGTARLMSERSTCSRAHVGVVIAKERRILSSGYNGAPRGLPHCDHECDCKALPGFPHAAWCRSEKPCTTAVHAEANAIAWAARAGVSLEGSELFTTFCPCLPCAQLIVNSGIRRVWYTNEYRDKKGLDLLVRAGVEVIRQDDLDAI